MYKSKLQVLCQQNSWSLPYYSNTKDGPDHKPRFAAAVTVNGFTFETTDQSGTAKDAQNKAAKLAFDHFSAPNAPRSAANSPLPTSSSDAHHLHKKRLQNYAQRRNITLPEYSCERKGSRQASHFKCKVTVDGKTYGSPEFYRTMKEAENAAAKVALESLPLNELQENDSGRYKNLLQELAQKGGFHVPKYETTISGPPHMPTVVSTVEIGRQSFQGQAAKSKKLAEMNAAKVAYIGLQERTLSYRSVQTSRIRSSPHIEGNYALHIYIPVRIPSTPMKELAQFLKKVSSLAPSLNAIGTNVPLNTLCNDDHKLEQVALGREFHISLARTVSIQVHQIDSMVAMLRHKLQFQRYWIDFSKLEVFVNDDRTRSFVSIEVLTGGLAEISKQIQAVNEVYKLYNLPEFYKDPRPHISIAWALNDISDLLKRVVQEAKRCTMVRGYVQKHIFTSKFSGINCKVGGKIYKVCKFQGGVSA